MITNQTPAERTVNLFKNGRSPAVRLPSTWVNDHDKARLTRVGRNSIVLTFIDDDVVDPLAAFLEDLADAPVPAHEWDGFEPETFLAPGDVDL